MTDATFLSKMKRQQWLVKTAGIECNKFKVLINLIDSSLKAKCFDFTDIATRKVNLAWSCIDTSSGSFKNPI